jgi:hypothetical protein
MKLMKLYVLGWKKTKIFYWFLDTMLRDWEEKCKYAYSENTLACFMLLGENAYGLSAYLEKKRICGKHICIFSKYAEWIGAYSVITQKICKLIFRIRI